MYLTCKGYARDMTQLHLQCSSKSLKIFYFPSLPAFTITSDGVALAPSVDKSCYYYLTCCFISEFRVAEVTWHIYQDRFLFWPFCEQHPCLSDVPSSTPENGAEGSCWMQESHRLCRQDQSQARQAGSRHRGGQTLHEPFWRNCCWGSCETKREENCQGDHCCQLWSRSSRGKRCISSRESFSWILISSGDDKDCLSNGCRSWNPCGCSSW